MKVCRILLGTIGMVISGCASVPASCPQLPLPAPVADTVHLDINDTKVDADEGGERLLRDYISLRKMIKGLWYE
jgi:hypothetical protein